MREDKKRRPLGMDLLTEKEVKILGQELSWCRAYGHEVWAETIIRELEAHRRGRSEFTYTAK